MLKASINRLIKISFYLFLFTNIAIFGTLFSQNILTQTIFDYNHYPSSNKEIKDFVCNQENNFCNETTLEYRCGSKTVIIFLPL